MTDWTSLGGNPVPTRPEDVLAAMAGLVDAPTDITSDQSAVVSVLSQVDGAWRSSAGEAWATKGAKVAQRLRPPAAHLDQATTVLRGYAATLSGLVGRAEALLAQADAAAHELASVGPPASPPVAATTIDPLAAQAAEEVHAEAVARLDAQLADIGAQRADLHAEFLAAQRSCVRSLEEIATAGMVAKGKTVSDTELRTLTQIAVAQAAGDVSSLSHLLGSLTPAQRADVFGDLETGEAAALAHLDPKAVGNLNGIPLPIRAIANRDRAEADLAAAKHANDKDRVKLLKSLLQHGSSLVLYDPAHDHYAVLWGDITAKHVAVFIPGVGNDGDVPGWIGNARNIFLAAPGSAVIMWKGYDDPPPPPSGSAASAAYTARATAGAQGVTDFAQDGLALTSEQTLTIVGHSYGSLVTGIALSQKGLRPTNVVIAGSPGMDVNDASQLHLRRDQLYVERAPSDYVANNLAGHGFDPAGPYFGSTRLRTNANSAPSVSGHSQYFSADSQALTGVAHVVTGHVTSGDVQKPSIADDVGAVMPLVVNPAQPLLNLATEHYHGPGGSVLETIDHVDQAVANNVGTATRVVVDTTEDVAGDVIDGFNDGLRSLTRWRP